MNDPTQGSRREELIAAALAGELTAAEEREFAAACASDPTMRADLDEIRDTAELLSDAGLSWREEQPSADLGDRIMAATDAPTSRSAPTSRTAPVPEEHDQAPTAVDTRAEESQGPPPPSGSPHRSGWGPGGRSLLMLAASVALVLLGAVGVLGLQALTSDSPPEGPPGTLGAVESVEFERAPAGSTIEASVVAHTWGTETILTADGLPTGRTYEIVLVSRGGEEMASGTFIGSEQPVNCTVNAALLREDVAEVRIKDSDGRALTTSTLPAVS